MNDERRGWMTIRAWVRSDDVVRIVPFALFMLFVGVGSMLSPPLPTPPDEFDSRWIFAVRTIVVGVVMLWLWPKFDELRWGVGLRVDDWLLAIAGGVCVLAIWVQLDHGWVTFELDGGFDPRRYDSEVIDWRLAVARFLGLALLVPVMEELFWRSYLMRWLEEAAFLRVDPSRVTMRALLISSAVFALEHKQWLAGFIAGLVYGLLYMRTRTLWVPIVSHATTNGGLGAYILVTHDWRFW